MMSKLFSQAALAPLMLAATVSAHAATWEIDPEDSKVIFKYSYSDTPYQGEFRNVQATFEIDPLSPSNCQIDVVIPIIDLEVGDEETESYMFDIELFDVDQFPTATFTADQCELTGVDSFTAKGM
ncbi:MAG: YceI family protein, partial [Pseudohongiella sp.]